MIAWRLVLRDGEVIDLGAPWKDPDGQPAKSPEGDVLPLEVGGIFLDPEQTISSGDDLDALVEEMQEVIETLPPGEAKTKLDSLMELLDEASGDESVTTHPVAYFVFARPTKGSSLEGSSETRMRRIPYDMVRYSEEVWQTKVTSQYIAEALTSLYGAVDKLNGQEEAPAQAPQPQTAAAPG